MSDSELNRLRWRCRRGMRELDLVLEGFLDQRGPEMSPTERESFRLFLESSDMDLYVWLTGRETPSDPGFLAVLEQISKQDKAATS